MRKIVLLVAATACASAQSADASLTFEVASVRISGQAATSTASASTASKSGASKSGAPSLNPVRFSRRGVTLERLLLNAYSIPLPQLLIGPEWLDSNAYDIEALAPQGSTPEQQLVMLQNLLIERFALKIHRETRELPVYEMVVAKGVPKMPVSGPKSPLAPMQQRPLPLGVGRGAMTYLGERGTMEQFAARLAPYVQRPTINRTGLQGEYDVTLRWTPGAQAPPAVAADAPDPGISIFSALQSQLGLKLDPKRGPVEVLVIDNVEKVPTEN
jgi:uncharacterized protein (TIGR03435 family)